MSIIWFQITKLKIDSNPFAKGFRDSSRLSEFDRDGLDGATSLFFSIPMDRLDCSAMASQSHSYLCSPLLNRSGDSHLDDPVKFTQDKGQ